LAVDGAQTMLAGYGAAVPKPMQLTDRGREAYRLL
jgi:hypothetical protein